MMKSFEATATVESSGEIHLVGVPFSAGTEVEVIVSPKRRSPDEFRRQWEAVCRQLRDLPVVATITDDEIAAEIAKHRAQR